jgi:imidazolonepropionase-like amidohydrolase
MKRVALFVMTVALSAVLRADAPGVYAITGGTVHPVAGAEIPDGIVVIRNGLIESVGANIAVPPDATVVDARGMHVYPGLIDAQTSLGFPALRVTTGRRGAPRAAQRDETSPPEPTAATLAARSIVLADDDVDARRSAGITTILAAPAAGIFNGQSVILNLGQGSIDSRVIRSPAALQISFNTRPSLTFPDSLMGVMAFIRQSFLDAQQADAAGAMYRRNPAGYVRPQTSAASEALLPALHRDLPVVFIAESETMMRRAEALAREFNLRLIVSGGRQAYRMADALKAAATPVLLSVNFPAPPTRREDREEQPLRIIRDRQLAPTGAAALARMQVPFALVSGNAKSPADFLKGIRRTIAGGLSADDALRAVTLTPARIFGVDRQLGSLEPGKIANVVISDKPIFDERAEVKHVYVDGRPYRVTAPVAAKDAAAGGDGSAVNGSWQVTVRASGGDVALHLDLGAEDGKVTGTYSGDRGSGDIENGTLAGNVIELKIAIRVEAETTDWLFHGTVTGNSMQGTVSTTSGTFQFSGSRSR